jgi:hypothetical protein
MSIKSADEAEEYYVAPEEALQFLPEEWQNHFRAMVDNHRAVLKSGDKELSQIIRISKSFSTLAALKHVQKRLAEGCATLAVSLLCQFDVRGNGRGQLSFLLLLAERAGYYSSNNASNLRNKTVFTYRSNPRHRACPRHNNQSAQATA